jgi:hypothetical protein
MCRRNLEKDELDKTKFNILVRFMIVAAEEKRFVEYNKLTKILGISLEDIRDYAGFLGHYCDSEKLPRLNSLIVNSTTGQPGEDFYNWAECQRNDWGNYVCECFQRFHLAQVNKFQNTSGINDSIIEF